MEIPTESLLSVVVVTLCSNVVLAVVGRKIDAKMDVTVDATMDSARRRVLEQRAMGAAIVYDTLALTVLLALSGGPINPFTVLYVVHVALAAVLLPIGWTWGVVALCAIGYGTLFPLHAPVSLIAQLGDVTFSGHLDGMWVAFLCAAVLIAVFVGRMTRVLMAREQELHRALRRIERSEKLASLATLAAGAAHEIATPLGTICVAAHEMQRVLQRNGQDPGHVAGLAQDAKLISEQVTKCQDILQRMSLNLGAPNAEVAQTMTPRELLQATQQELESPQLVIACETDVPIAAFPRLLTESLVNVCRNALEASEPGASVVLSARRELEMVVFAVRDSGCGMSEQTLARVGEPFFTTKPAGKGMGLGLFVARTLSETNGGSLAVHSVLGQGTTVELRWPLASSPAAIQGAS